MVTTRSIYHSCTYDVELWKTSGHWKHYQDGMFRVPFKISNPVASSSSSENATPNIDTTTSAENKDKRLFILKPTVLTIASCLRVKSVPTVRFLGALLISVIHRNEASGVLSGLTRVRKFQQDDGHIFCTFDQVNRELEGLFDFMTYVYALFEFLFKLKLFTRPDSYMGKLEDWDRAEEQLKQALQAFRGDNCVLNPGDGAFYGPKIDVTVNDAMGREFQCATIQLDFQLPQSFNFQYRVKEAGPSAKSPEAQSEAALAPGTARPVMIHRAVIRSFDRFLAVICEHFAGKWPLWLSPRQIMVIPIMKEAKDYNIEVRSVFQKVKMYVDTDLSGNTLPKKIRNAQMAKYHFILVVSAKERDSRAVNIRNRDDPATQQQGAMM